MPGVRGMACWLALAGLLLAGCDREEGGASGGRRIYAAKGGMCVPCHGADGAGKEDVPPLKGSQWVLGDESRPIRIVLLGVTGPINVNGKTYNSTQMPSFGPALGDTQVSAVLTYIRQEWSNKAPAVTPEAVRAARDAIKGRMSPFTEAELLPASP